MSNVTCPQCGGIAHCQFTGDVGGVDYHDEYSLVCDLCGHQTTDTVYGGSPISSDGATECPFCMRRHGAEE
jgi:C4-type Zn-finger protein